MVERKWIAKAWEARHRLSAVYPSRYDAEVPDGWDSATTSGRGKGRLVHLHEVAGELGITTGTLRSYLIALDALEAISEPEIREIMKTHSPVAVAAFGRWLRRDEREALEYVYYNRNATWAALMDAERKSRKAVSSRRRSEVVLDEGLLSRAVLGPYLSSELDSYDQVLHPPLELVPSRGAYRFCGLDRLIARAGTREPPPPFSAAGVIELPRWQLLESYGQRAKEIWSRAAGASAHCPIVLVLLPGPAARRRLLAAFPTQGDPDDLSLGVTSETPRVWVGNSSRARIYRAAPGNGLIVFTSTLTLLRDLSE